MGVGVTDELGAFEEVMTMEETLVEATAFEGDTEVVIDTLGVTVELPTAKGCINFINE